MSFLFNISFVEIIDIIFSLGLFFNAALFVPQILRIIRTKSAEGVSLFTFIGFNIMQVFTVLHGYFAKDYALMIGFLLSFFTCGTVTYLALKYRKKPEVKTEIKSTEPLENISIASQIPLDVLR